MEDFQQAEVKAIQATPSNAADDEEPVSFPPPLSQLDRLKRAAVFWSKAVPIVANYYGLIGSIKLQEILGESLDDETIEVRKTGGVTSERIKRSINELMLFILPK